MCGVVCVGGGGSARRVPVVVVNQVLALLFEALYAKGHSSIE